MYYISSLTLILSLFLTLIFFNACSLFSHSPKNNNQNSSSQFRVTASTNENPIPLPVEIATDISKINQELPLEKNSSASQEEPSNSLEENSTIPQKKEDKIAPNPRPSLSRNTHVSNKIQNHKTGTIDYKIKRGDTLMKISFEHYGNIYRWREIYDFNKDRIAHFNSLPTGTTIQINGVEYVLIHRNGKPYLIIKNDTLIKISQKLYGTIYRWKDIWKNNPELIRDPNKIYAGFTLYYIPHNNLLINTDLKINEINPSKDRKPSSK